MACPPPAAGPGSSGGPRLGTSKDAGARTSSGAGPAADLLTQVMELRARVAELERVQMCGDADRPMRLAELAKRIGPGKSVATLRGWIKRPASRRKYRLEMLLRRDPTGHWYSTPRLLAAWSNALAKSAQHLIVRRWVNSQIQTPNRPPALPGEGTPLQARPFGTARDGAVPGTLEDK